MLSLYHTVCSESTKESDRGVVEFRIRGVAGVVAELRDIVRKEKEVEVLPVVDLAQ